MTRALPVVIALALAAPLSAQEAESPEPSSPLVGAAWCTVHEGEEDAPDRPGCDIGVGLALYRRERLSVVVALGTETGGLGFAWTAYRPEEGPVLAVAVGLVVRYDERGVNAAEVYPAVGVTMGFRRTP